MEDNLKGKTKKGLYWRFFDQFANYGMQFCVGIVMARLLSPEDYGITALPAVFMLVAGTIQDGGLGSALIRKPNLSDMDLSTSFYYSICVGIFMYVALFFAAPLIENPTSPNANLEMDGQNVSGDEQDSSKPREQTRSKVALLFVLGFFAILFLCFAYGVKTNASLSELKDVLIGIIGALSGTLGFIIGFYYKSLKEQ